MSVFRHLYRCSLLMGLGLAASGNCFLSAGAEEGRTGKAAPGDVLDARIVRLIEDLGATAFATREKAQAELQRLGLAAFDALHAAQYHDDIEIAMRARYLVRSIQVNWVLESDPVEVKRILRDYGEKEELDRKSRMEQLAQLEEGAGLDALARLARFEPNGLLSKHAALLALKQYVTVDKSQREAAAQRIQTVAGSSQRAASQWLRNLADTFRDPESALERWDELTHAEEMAFAQFPEQTSRLITRDLLRWQADLLLGLEHHAAAGRVMERSIHLMESDREELLDTIGWLMERKAWALVDKVAERHPGQFADDPLLLYRLAESQLRRGASKLAEETAERARNLAPEDAEIHVRSATWLNTRGLLDWSKAELQYVISLGPPGATAEIEARMILAEMYHDGLQELAAAKEYQAVVEAMQQDPKVLEWVQQRRGDVGSIRARLHYFYALHYASEGDRQKQKEHLREAIGNDPTDADALIAMYRFPDADQGWNEEARRLIADAARHFHGQIEQWQQHLDRINTEPARATYEYVLATANNQYAWLVGNTEGDYDEALRCSHRSLQLRPQTAGYLDTLGRCYFAKGDLENAIKYQAQAVELEPHSLQIRRQLEYFQQALDDRQQQSASQDEAPAPDEPE